MTRRTPVAPTLDRPTRNSLTASNRTFPGRGKAQNPGKPVPIERHYSGLVDPQYHQAGAEFQIPRVARERGMSEDAVQQLIARHTEGRQFGFLGEPRVNVLMLNLELDATHPMAKVAMTTDQGH